MMRPTVGVVGSGRVGSVLAARLRAAGHRVVAVSGRSSASRLRIDTLLPGVRVAEPVEVAEAADILVIAVPDDALIEVVETLAPHVREGQVVLHTSGRHGLDALAAATRRGARPIAFHPAMTFTGTAVDLDRTCVFGVTAGAAERPVALELAEALGGTVAWIAESERVAYHAALAHGANHLATVVNQAMDLLRSAGAADPAAILRPLLEASLENSLAYGDAALTGPVARGDVTTIRAHLDALAGDDAATASAYVALARATSRRAEADGRIDHATGEEIRRTLDESAWDALARIAAGVR